MGTTDNEYAALRHYSHSMNIANMNMPKLFNEMIEFGFNLIKNGETIFSPWIMRMSAQFDNELEQAGFESREIEALFSEIWRSDFNVYGKVHTLKEWACIFDSNSAEAINKFFGDKKESITKLNDISIEHMIENVFTSTTIKKKRKDIVAYYVQQFNVDLLGSIQLDGEEISVTKISAKVDSVLKEDKNSENPYLTYSSPYYKKARRKAKPINPADTPDSNYLGKAAECVVMGELLFRGYNVNSMMVDEGVDLVASKNNMFFYIQVKTKTVTQQNKFHFYIRQERFQAYIETQMRYVLVGRCKLNGEDRNIFFRFDNGDIQRLIHSHVIPLPSENSDGLSLKIEFDPRTGKAYMYDGKFKEDVSFYMNNFDL